MTLRGRLVLKELEMAVTWKFRCASYVVFTSMLVAVLATRCLSAEVDIVQRVLTGSLALLVGISSLIALHITSLPCSESHTLRTLLLSYRWHQGEKIATPSLVKRLSRMWMHPRKAQEELLRKLTRRDGNTEYGRRYHLGEIHCLEDLKKQPLTSYEHYRGYMERLANGEKGVIFGEKPVRFGITSGTTGLGKKVPYGRLFHEIEHLCKECYRLTGYMGSSRPSPVQKRCSLYTHPKISHTKTGVTVAPYSLLTKDSDPLAFAEHSSPPPAFLISDEPCATYVHLLFAIADRNLGNLTCSFAPQMYQALKCLESNWEMMLLDLSTGQINTKLPLAPDLRRSIEGYIVADPGRIAELRKEFEKGFEGIVKRMWPNLAFLDFVKTLEYKKTIQDTYGKGSVCLGIDFGCTETPYFAFSVSAGNNDEQYAFLPSVCVFEFIPEEQTSEENPKSLFIDEVEVGKKYELVLTTTTGLYRYRYGDVVEIVGFHEKCPVFRMKYRIGELLNLGGERTNSVIATAAITKTVKGWPGCQLIDWTCAESALCDATELFYILFVELDPANGELKLTEEQRLQFDENLQECNPLYKNCRVSRTIAAAHVHVVRPGTFKALKDNVVSRTTASDNQFKMPRKMRTREHLEWMMKGVI